MSDNIRPNRWPEIAIENKRTNKDFFKLLRQQNKESFAVTLVSIHNTVFEKTDCLACANCCRTTPALVNKEDINRISKHLKLSSKEFIKTYLLQDYNGEYIIRRVPCTFLQDDNTCKIYEVRPEACRRYPHTDEKEFIYRPDLNVANTIVCPAAYSIMERLKMIVENNE